jgi:multidrug efflux pump subunit AcrA (membrane-fusion protein)
MANRWKIVVFSFCMIFLIAGCGTGNQNKPTPTPIPQIVTTEKIVFTVERGPLISQREVIGEIVPANQDELFFRASGYIARVLIKNGDYIKKGDVLAELQMDDLLDQLQQARIDLEVSQDNLNNEKLQRAYDIQKAESDVVICQKQVDIAQLNLEAAYGLQKEEAQINVDISQEKLKTAQAYLDLIKGEVNSDIEKVVKRNQVAVERLERMVSERQLIAPYDGIVLYTGLIPGTQAEAYSTAALVGNPTNLVIRVTYDYDLVNTVDTSTVVNLFLTKTKDQSYPVQFIQDFLPISNKKEGINVQGDNNISLNYLFFSMPKDLPLDRMPVGSQVYLQIVIGNKPDALILPPPAIRGNDEFKYVIVLEGDYHRRVEVVHIGLKTTDKWEIVANLKEGDQVLGP